MGHFGVSLDEQQLFHYKLKQGVQLSQRERTTLYVNLCWHQKNRVPGLSYNTVCVILGLDVLVQYWRVTDRRLDR